MHRWVTHSLPNAFYSRVETFNDAKLLNETSDKWPLFTLFFGKFRFRFKGGAHLLAEVQVSDVYEQRMAALWPDVRDILRAERSKVGTIRLQKESRTN